MNEAKEALSSFMSDPSGAVSGAVRARTPGQWRDRLGGLGRALVVEDDDSLRKALCRWLRSVQIQVSEAETVASALARLSTAPELVITDVRLPDGSGRRVVEEASQLRPRPLIVAISGSASPPEAFALGQGGARIYLTKPFAEQDLLASIADVSRDVIGSDPDPEIARSLARFSRCFGVPEREMALVRLAMGGVSRARCPELLGVTENTCKTLIRRLLQRCGARSLAQIPRLVLMRDSTRSDA